MLRAHAAVDLDTNSTDAHNQPHRRGHQDAAAGRSWASRLNIATLSMPNSWQRTGREDKGNKQLKHGRHGRQQHLHTRPTRRRTEHRTSHCEALSGVDSSNQTAKWAALGLAGADRLTRPLRLLESKRKCRCCLASLRASAESMKRQRQRNSKDSIECKEEQTSSCEKGEPQTPLGLGLEWQVNVIQMVPQNCRVFT